MYARVPSESELKQSGLLVEDYEEEAEVWPENWQVFRLFSMMRTQWQTGMGGATGLRYEAVYPLIDRQYSDPEEWDQAFGDVRVMEAAALRAMREK